MPMVDDKFVCAVCGAEAIESWPFIHCYKCGNREDRPDLGLDASNQPMQGTVYGGGTPDDPQAPADPVYGGGTPDDPQAPADPSDIPDDDSPPVYDGGTYL